MSSLLTDFLFLLSYTILSLTHRSPGVPRRNLFPHPFPKLPTFDPTFPDHAHLPPLGLGCACGRHPPSPCRSRFQSSVLSRPPHPPGVHPGQVSPVKIRTENKIRTTLPRPFKVHLSLDQTKRIKFQVRSTSVLMVPVVTFVTGIPSRRQPIRTRLPPDPPRLPSPPPPVHSL